jgi:hypothetical protein
MLLAVLLAGCPDRSISKVVTTEYGVATKEIPIVADLDILFVIDNSASTADKQALFAANFPKFTAALDAFPGGRPNLHIGVVSTTVGTGSDRDFGATCPKTAPNDDGLLQNMPRVTGCVAPTGRFISDVKDSSGARVTNYSGTLDTALSCVAQLGTNGCGFEAQFESMKRALDGSRPENAGFLRKNAYLAVIFLTDEDDCSVKDASLFDLDADAAGPGDFRCQPLHAYKCDTPISATNPGTYTNCQVLTGSYLQDPSYYFTFLSSIKDPSKIVVAMIAGDATSTMTMTGAMTTPFVQTLALQPSCHTTINGNDAIGRPGIRLNAFTSLFGSRGSFQSVCQSDYSGALADIGKSLFDAISPCLEGAIDQTDADTNNPGVQPQCAVSDVLDDGIEAQIPTCAMSDAATPSPTGARPCWWVKANPATCQTETGFELHVERTSPPADGTTLEASCAISQM